jgi:hypothetical protein
MSTENNNNDNMEEIYTGEETYSIPEYQEPNNDTPLPPPPPPPSNGFGFGTPGFSPAFPLPSTTATGMNNLFGQPATVIAGAFGGAPRGGAFSIPLTTAASFGSLGGLQPTGMGGCFGMASRIERHPETGQPIPMGCNLMPPQGACGGIRNSHPGSSQNYQPFGFKPANTQPDILNIQSNKKKSIDDLYKKLAYARAQIQNLNKVIDEIYETLPNIN